MRRLVCLVFLTASMFTAAQVPAPHAIEIVVRPTEIDVKGHVNNAKYIEYLQWARWDWLDRKGLTNDRLTELGATLVVARIEIDYRREAKNGDVLAASVAVEKIGEKSFTLHQAVAKADGSEAAVARVVMVAVDIATHKSRSLPDELRRAIQAPN